MLTKFLSVLGIYKFYEKWLWHQIKNGTSLEHIAIILDGNRRWASGKSLDPWFGHEMGAEKVEQLLNWCLKLDVKSITLYAFSTENFSRTENEVREIMRIIENEMEKILRDESIHTNKVNVKVIGRKNLLPKSLQNLIIETEKATKNYNDHFLNIALAYGGREEIVDAARKIAEKVWPDFRFIVLLRAVRTFQKRKRRFGK